STASATRSRTCSLASKIGGAYTPGTTDVLTPSCRQSPSPQSLSSGSMSPDPSNCRCASETPSGQGVTCCAEKLIPVLTRENDVGSGSAVPNPFRSGRAQHDLNICGVP